MLVVRPSFDTMLAQYSIYNAWYTDENVPLSFSVQASPLQGISFTLFLTPEFGNILKEAPSLTASMIHTFFVQWFNHTHFQKYWRVNSIRIPLALDLCDPTLVFGNFTYLQLVSLFIHAFQTASGEAPASIVLCCARKTAISTISSLETELQSTDLPSLTTGDDNTALGTSIDRLFYSLFQQCQQDNLHQPFYQQSPIALQYVFPEFYQLDGTSSLSKMDLTYWSTFVKNRIQAFQTSFRSYTWNQFTIYMVPIPPMPTTWKDLLVNDTALLSNAHAILDALFRQFPADHLALTVPLTDYSTVNMDATLSYWNLYQGYGTLIWSHLFQGQFFPTVPFTVLARQSFFANYIHWIPSTHSVTSVPPSFLLNPASSAYLYSPAMIASPDALPSSSNVAAWCPSSSQLYALSVFKLLSYSKEYTDPEIIRKKSPTDAVAKERINTNQQNVLTYTLYIPPDTVFQSLPSPSSQLPSVTTIPIHTTDPDPDKKTVHPTADSNDENHNTNSKNPDVLVDNIPPAMQTFQKAASLRFQPTVIWIAVVVWVGLMALELPVTLYVFPSLTTQIHLVFFTCLSLFFFFYLIGGVASLTADPLNTQKEIGIFGGCMSLFFIMNVSVVCAILYNVQIPHDTITQVVHFLFQGFTRFLGVLGNAILVTFQGLQNAAKQSVDGMVILKDILIFVLIMCKDMIEKLPALILQVVLFLIQLVTLVITVPLSILT